MTPAAKKIPATPIPGDGIGPEIVAAAVEILNAAGAPFAWERHEGDMTAIGKHGDPLPPALLASIRRTGLALKGPLTAPVGGGYRSVNVRLREEFGLFANVRPVRSIVPGGRYDNVDLVLIRENLEGLYVAWEHYLKVGDNPHAVAMSAGVNTRSGGERIAKFAYAYAVRNRRKKVTIDDRIVDACVMQLVLDPWQFDLILTTNLFGDTAAIFEAVHGSAPDIAGKGIPNKIRASVDHVLRKDNFRAPDLGGRARTRDITRAVIRRLEGV